MSSPAFPRRAAATSSAPANLPECVDINLGDRSYPILIGAGLLDDPASFNAVPSASSALIVTNTTVSPLYAEALPPRPELPSIFRPPRS